MKYILILLLFSILLACSEANSKTIVTYATGVEGDARTQYEYNLLKLALDKTLAEYGEYELVIRPGDTTPSYSRLRVEAEDNEYTNMVYKDSVSNDLVNKLLAIEFPVDLGASGYRVGLTSQENKLKLSNIRNKENVIQLKMIQGRGWLDGDILRSQGFKVIEGRYIEGLFFMAANKRGDLFPLGAHELKREWDKYKYIDGLAYDTNLCIYYPLPKFFFTNPENVKLGQRIEQGLKQSYESGELIELWKSYFLEKIQFANLKERRLFKFKNPMIDKVGTDYEQYILDPQKL
ncbi:hypothetical protein N7931_08130 [Catenovulum sp. 2E275]|uniref:hypothetical protein n=1 Tax=Catenovulum sp. 2E275 TaxID=2980497 RepID=UPI0021D117E6|nr:hypothetical protein [Catenovulum sp. 2E275]MCU4675603.1 hypothetical protein [Catenovulum sp. 2E275]